MYYLRCPGRERERAQVTANITENGIRVVPSHNRSNALSCLNIDGRIAGQGRRAPEKII